MEQLFRFDKAAYRRARKGRILLYLLPSFALQIYTLISYLSTDPVQLQPGAWGILVYVWVTLLVIATCILQIPIIVSYFIGHKVHVHDYVAIRDGRVVQFTYGIDHDPEMDSLPDKDWLLLTEYTPERIESVTVKKSGALCVQGSILCCHYHLHIDDYREYDADFRYHSSHSEQLTFKKHCIPAYFEGMGQIESLLRSQV